MVVTKGNTAMNRALEEPSHSAALVRAMASFWSQTPQAHAARVIDLQARRPLRPANDSVASTEAAGGTPA